MSALTDDQRGLLWLLAYEHHYRQQIFAALHANHGRASSLAGKAQAHALVAKLGLLGYAVHTIPASRGQEFIAGSVNAVIRNEYLPSIDLPSIPWPDIQLPSIPWPEWELPGWVQWVRDRARYVVPVLVGIGLARSEIRRRKSQPAKRAELRRRSGSIDGE